MFWKLCFDDFRTAQPVFGTWFLNTLGRHSLFWVLFFENLKAAERVLGVDF